jgi:hypothetical protein
MLDLNVGRENEDARLGEFLANRLRCVEPLGCMRRRHANVDENQLGRLSANELDELLAVVGLPGDFEPRPRK